MEVPTRWSRIISTSVLLAGAVGVVVLAFSWPSITSQGKNLPVVVTGQTAAVEEMIADLDDASPGLFDSTIVDDRAAAESAVRKRDAYGAIIAGPAPEVLIASAGGAAASQFLVEVAEAHGATVIDVVPYGASDPRGVGLAAAAFPLTMGGMFGGIGITILVTGTVRRLVTLFVYAVTTGLLLTGILQGLFGALQGSFVANAAAIALSILSIGGVIVGFSSIVGRAGVAIGPVLFLLIANPISSANAPVEFLAGPWGAIGQFFPPGATATLLRSLSYFSEAATAFPWLTLTAWACIGTTMGLIGVVRDRRRSTGLVRQPPSQEGNLIHSTA